MEKSTEKIILETARRHFVQRGFAGTRMQAIADEAQINKAMLHYYYRSKAKLYQEVIAQVMNSIFPKIAKAMETSGSFQERMEKVVDAYITLLLEQPDIPNFIMSELTHKRERFVAEIKKKAIYFPAIQSFIQQMQMDMNAGKIRQLAPMHLFLNIASMTIFPFVAKPIFLTVFEIQEKDFEALMLERKAIIKNFINQALKID